MMASISNGVRMAHKECQFQFRSRRFFFGKLELFSSLHWLERDTFQKEVFLKKTNFDDHRDLKKGNTAKSRCLRPEEKVLQEFCSKVIDFLLSSLGSRSWRRGSRWEKLEKRVKCKGMK